MTHLADADATLDDILARYHHWASSSRMGKGYAPRALVCGNYKTSRQYDDQNGALDSDIEGQIMKAVDFQISEMTDPHRSAIYCLARNLWTGRTVWLSPRLPDDVAQRSQIIADARLQLTKRLTAAGIL